MDGKKEYRTRPIKLMVRVSAREKELISEKMALAGIRNREAYLRKMAIDGYIIHLDLSDVKELSTLLRRYGNNLNQLTICAHETGYIGADDLEAVKRHTDELWDAVRKILTSLASVIK